MGKLISTAIANKLEPDDVRNYLGVARTSNGKISPGALFTRIENAIPGEDPTQRWIEPAQRVIDGARSREAAASMPRPNPAAETATRNEAKKAANERLAALEAEFGGIIDGMNPDDFASLCNAAKLSPPQRAIAVRDRRAKIARRELLNAVQATHIKARPEIEASHDTEAKPTTSAIAGTTAS